MDPYRIQRREMRKTTPPTVVAGDPPVLARARGQPCPYCGTPMTKGGRHAATRDHIMPRSKKPARFHLGQVNRAIVCFRCNRDKRSMTLKSFHARLAETNDHRAVHIAKFMDALIEKVGDRETFRRLVGGDRRESP